MTEDRSLTVHIYPIADTQVSINQVDVRVVDDSREAVEVDEGLAEYAAIAQARIEHAEKQISAHAENAEGSAA